MSTHQTSPSVEVIIPDTFTLGQGGSGLKRGLSGPLHGAIPLDDEDRENPGVDPVIASLAANEFELIDAVHIVPGAHSAQTRGATGSPEKAQINVDLHLDEDAIVLLEQDGLYLWKFPSFKAEAQLKRSDTNFTKRLTFEFEVLTSEDEAPAKRNILGKVAEFGLSKIKAYVLKFIAGKTIAIARDLLEKNVQEGMIYITDPDPSEWRSIESLKELRLETKEARLLFFVHGTFSSTVGGFGALGATPWGRSFLQAALQRYDAVIGYNHKTLGVDPLENAEEILLELEQLKGTSLKLDIITHSRGGLVVRSLIEKLLPKAPEPFIRIGRVVFVGSTNAGTLLAEPANWKDLIDLYTTIVSASARVIGFIAPHSMAVTATVNEVVKNIGSFVKYLATAAITDDEMPGLAAMEPGGDFVKDINLFQEGQPGVDNSDYCIITSDFQPKLAVEGDIGGLPKRLLAILAAGFMGSLMKEENDLVVNTNSMGAIDAEFGDFIKMRYDFGPNASVYHTNYFTRPEVANALVRWFELEAPKQTQARRGRPESAEPKSLPLLPNVLPSLPVTLSPAVDTDIMVVHQDGLVGDLPKIVENMSPSYVVVSNGQDASGMQNYAFKTEEFLTMTEGRELSLLSDALDLENSPPSGVQPIAGAVNWPANYSRSYPSRRGVVVFENFPVGVVAESELPDTSELIKAASAIKNPVGLDDLLLVRRSMPTFSASEDNKSVWSPPQSLTPFGDPNPAAEGGGGPKHVGYQVWEVEKKDPLVVKTTTPSASSERPLLCNIMAEIDEKIVIERISTLQITLSKEEMTRAFGKVSVQGEFSYNPEQKLIVVIIPKQNLALAENEDGRVELDMSSEQSWPVELYFDLKSTGLGTGEVWVIARQDAQPLAKLILKPEIVDSPPASDNKIEEGKGVRQALFPPATLNLLRIEEKKTSEGIFYTYNFMAPGLKVLESFQSQLITGDRVAYISALYKKIDDRWLSTQMDVTNFTRELRAIGIDLLDELMPPPMQKLLWEKADQLDSIFVVSREPFIPWELVHLREPGKRGLPTEILFLGQMGLVRWLEGAGADGWAPENLVIREDGARYVLPKYPVSRFELPEAQKEIDFLVKEFNAKPIKADSVTLGNLLAQAGSFDLLHFACHGDADMSNIEDASLLMEGRVENANYIFDRFSATTAKRIGDLSLGANAPMVVLNACKAGLAGNKLSGIGGFADAFLTAGAGVFIGTLWSIGDVQARSFIISLYEQLKAGSNLAKATREARESTRLAGDATWLSYVVYGNPHLVIDGNSPLALV